MLLNATEDNTILLNANRIVQPAEKYCTAIGPQPPLCNAMNRIVISLTQRGTQIIIYIFTNKCANTLEAYGSYGQPDINLRT
jgi:hypothetical protein